MTKFSRRHGLKLFLSGVAALPILGLGARPARAANHMVQIKDFAFAPEVLQVAPGDTVVFMNLDSAPHTATAENGGFDTGRISPGDEKTVQIPGEGEFVYLCKFHPSMQGAVIAG